MNGMSRMLPFAAGCFAAATAFAGTDLVLYEAGRTPAAVVESGKLVVTGEWDISAFGRIEITFAEPCRKPPKAYSSAFIGSECSLLLENPGAVPPDPRARHSEGAFWSKIVVKEGSDLGSTPIPPAMPDLQACISKMNFISDKGLLSRVWPSEHWGSSGRGKGAWIRTWTLDPKKVTRLTFTWPHEGRVARIVAAGPANRVEGELPAFAKMKPEDFFPFIDKFGQFKWYDWPGKIHSDEEFRQAQADEEKDLAAHPGPAAFDKWGGWKDGPKQQATGAFYIKKINGMWWFVDPDGNLWWSNGPVRVSPSSAMTFYNGRENYFDWLPPKETSPYSLFYHTRDELMWPYWEKRGITNTFDFSACNLYRKYGEDWHAKWAELVHRRLRSWGANTIANSSDRAVEQLSKTPYIERFEVKSRPIEGTDLKRGWWPFRDPFDASFAANVREQLKARAYEITDPWCVGFFVDNELPWNHEDDTHLARIAWASPEDQPAKIEFRKDLAAKYGKAPETPSVEDFRAFTRRIARQYFGEIRRAFDELAPKKLYLGCRGMEREFIAESAEPFVDAMSQNWYGDMKDFFRPTDPGRFYCCSGLEKVDKPILIGEFHFGAKDRGPLSGTLRCCENQQARADAYLNKVSAALEHPKFIGAHWHQYSDQPTAGRFDGEAMQNGWTDVCDNPYPETIAAIRWIGDNMYRLRWEAGLRLSQGFELVRDGRACVTVVPPDYEEVAADVEFFTKALAKVGGKVEEWKGGKVKEAGDGNRIVFEVVKRPIPEEDDWSIDFPDERTMRITGTAMSCRWALNWILEEKLGCCFCFPGAHGSHYPKLTSASMPREPVKGTMGLKLQRDLYREDPAWQRAMGGKKAQGNFMGHNLKNFLPIEKYAKDPWREKIMPEINGKRIVPKYPGKAWNNCYANEESVTESVKNICAYLREHPELKVYSLSINDNSGHCQCAGCRELNGGTLDLPCRYGSPGHKSLSAAYYKWVNRVAAGVAAEFPEVLLGLLAYRNTIDPPGFKLHPNVVPFLCVDTSQLTEPGRIANRRELFAAWSACAERFGQWDYAYGFRYKPARVYMKTMDAFYKWHREFPAFGGVFAEGDTYMGEGPKRWWHYKLMADPEADMEAALGRWYEACCGRSAAKPLKEYYTLLEEFWTGSEVRRTDWFRNTNGNTYLNFSEDTYLFALPPDLMDRLGKLMDEVVGAAEKDGDDDQRWRAKQLREYHAMYAARCRWNGAGHSRPDGSFGGAAKAAEYVRALPGMCEACGEAIRLADRLEEIRRTELGRPLPVLDYNPRWHLEKKGKRRHFDWGETIWMQNPNFAFMMNEAMRYLGSDAFSAALAEAAVDGRLFPDYAETLRSLTRLESAPDCAYAGIASAADDLASWTRKTSGRSLAVESAGERSYRLRNASGDGAAAIKFVTGLERGYYLFRSRVKNEASHPVTVSAIYHSASPNFGDTDPVGLRASAAIAPGRTAELTVFCREKEAQASLAYHVSTLEKGESVVVEKVEFLRLGVMADVDAITESVNPGRKAAAKAATKRALREKAREHKEKRGTHQLGG